MTLFNPQKPESEFWLHTIWKQKKFDSSVLYTENKLAIQILFEGWYNRGSGPDFKNARLKIGDQEFFGDIEFHIEESSWYSHKHDQNPDYHKVILHIFWITGKKPALNHCNQPIPRLCLGEQHIAPFWEEFFQKTKLKEPPGACGITLTSEKNQKIKSILLQAAENRFLQKAEKIKSDIASQTEAEQENYLFSLILKYSLPHSVRPESQKLAFHYPYSFLKNFLSQPPRQAREELLSRWFGAFGLFDHISSLEVHDELRREWSLWTQHWQSLENESVIKKYSRGNFRPQNTPERRLLGIFYHLDQTKFQGLLKSWFEFLTQCQEVTNSNKPKISILNKKLNSFFPQPTWEILGNFLSLKNGSKQQKSQIKLIGTNQQRIILANAILPFFYAYHQVHELSKNPHYEEFPKIIFKIFLLLPNEGANQKTRFIEERLDLKKSEIQFRKNLSFYQGLIQIHEECCHSFYQGCQNCLLLNLLKT